MSSYFGSYVLSQTRGASHLRTQIEIEVAKLVVTAFCVNKKIARTVPCNLEYVSQARDPWVLAGLTVKNQALDPGLPVGANFR
jgi:hypothetical protein